MKTTDLLVAIHNCLIFVSPISGPIRGIKRQFLENICSEDDLRSRIFGTFVVEFLACLPLLGFLNPPKMPIFDEILH